jgi:hypothetical protein
MKMVKSVYSVQDIDSGIYDNIFAVRHEIFAVRSFETLVNTPGNDVSSRPEAYSLVKLGTYDDVSGELISENSPVLVKRGHEMVRRPGSPVETVSFEPVSDEVVSSD